MKGISQEDYGEIKKSFNPLESSLLSVATTEQEFCLLGDVNTSSWTESSGGDVKALIEKNSKALENPNWLNTWIDYLRLKIKLFKNGLEEIVVGVESTEIQTHDLKDLINLIIFNKISAEILQENEYLYDFSGLEQTAIREKFQQYDRKILKLEREKIAYNASRNKPIRGNASGKVSNYTETSLIQHEANKKTRHIALRNLLNRSGESIQALKPCFMMSPMSVAQYLKPGDFDFDIVIMDEASQIRPEEALGSIARGETLVVVGDPKQLPPTSFFSKLVGGDEDEDTVALQESESILESVIPIFKNRRLRWHYRSRHESLIAFSNKHFYDSNLIIFPSPHQNSSELGIRYRFVEKGRYQSSRNVEEAHSLIDSVAQQIINNHRESVGIVAMNSQQQAELEMHLDQKLKDDPLFSEAYDNNSENGDPLFIKNLENVQGDERDVIFISMTYGPETIGGKVFQRFGPINTSVGWRRLNVLFTRSKKRMHVFSSMRSSDIHVDGESSSGKRALRYFLEYCEKGHTHESRVTGRAPDSDFEISVMAMLNDKGYECEPQLGVAGFFIDLAVKDPGNPGKYLMAIECDGATYHSAKSARDRDRLRQDILEDLGWNVRRIWSTDWFKNPQAQISPIIQELEKLKTPIYEQVELLTEEIDKDKPDILTYESESSHQSENEHTDLAEEPVEELDLKERLKKLKLEKINKQFPKSSNENSLLRPGMIEALLSKLPCSKAEFLEYIPEYLRQGTNVEEAKYFLDEVLELIADYG